MNRRFGLSVLMATVSLSMGCGDDGSFPGPGAPAPHQEPDSGIVWVDAMPLAPSNPYEPKQTMYSHSGDKLFRIDPMLLKVEEVGPFHPNAPHMTDLAVTPDGQLYSISNNNVYQVSPDDASVKWVAKVSGALNVALTFDKDGTLLAADKSGGFRRIDPVTGQVTEIGNYGTGLGSSGDLVGLADGTLYDVNDVDNAKKNNQLIKVDPATGKATVVGNIGYRMVWGLSFWGGTLYGFTRQGQFVAIDPATGVGSLIHSYSNEFWGAAVTPKAPLTLK